MVSVAQWQSTGLWPLWPRVQSPPLTPCEVLSSQTKGLLLNACVLEGMNVKQGKDSNQTKRVQAFITPHHLVRLSAIRRTVP